MAAINVDDDAQVISSIVGVDHHGHVKLPSLATTTESSSGTMQSFITITDNDESPDNDEYYDSIHTNELHPNPSSLSIHDGDSDTVSFQHSFSIDDNQPSCHHQNNSNNSQSISFQIGPQHFDLIKLIGEGMMYMISDDDIHLPYF